MFSKSTLKKMKKDELIELIMHMQQNMTNKTLYDGLKSDRDAKIVYYLPKTDFFGNKLKERVVWRIGPGDEVTVTTEEITPSGYPRSGTLMEVFRFRLPNVLSRRKYEKVKKIGWNKETVEIIKKALKINI